MPDVTHMCTHMYTHSTHARHVKCTCHIHAHMCKTCSLAYTQHACTHDTCYMQAQHAHTAYINTRRVQHTCTHRELSQGCDFPTRRTPRTGFRRSTFGRNTEASVTLPPSVPQVRAQKKHRHADLPCLNVLSIRGAELLEKKRVHTQGSLERSPPQGREVLPDRKHVDQHHEGLQTCGFSRLHSGQQRGERAGPGEPPLPVGPRPSPPGRPARPPGGPGPAQPPPWSPQAVLRVTASCHPLDPDALDQPRQGRPERPNGCVSSHPGAWALSCSRGVVRAG